MLGSQKNLFERVVMFEYPRRESWAIGFVTSKHHGPLEARTGKDYFHVFVPTTPNPTSGFYLLVPEEDVIEVDISVEEAFKVIMSAGLVTPSTDGSLTQPVAPGPTSADGLGGR